MGMDLEGPGRYFRWTNLGWYDLLELAKEFGWVPIGTGPPRGTLKAQWRHGRHPGNLDYYGNAASACTHVTPPPWLTPWNELSQRLLRATLGGGIATPSHRTTSGDADGEPPA